MSTYEEVPVRGRQIRVLELAPGEAADGLTGELKVVSLDTNVCYDAISYVWGSNVLPSTIELPSGRLQITMSVDRALRRFRDWTEKRRLWADSICINQTDDDEKSRQVALMGDIYRQASKVLIWVGEADEGCDMSGLAFWMMQFLSSFAVENRLHLTNVPGPDEVFDPLCITKLQHAFSGALRELRQRSHAEAPLRQNLWHPEIDQIPLELRGLLLDCVGTGRVHKPGRSIDVGGVASQPCILTCPCQCVSASLTTDDETCFLLAVDSVITLFARPWFERIWVLQEAALAREAAFRCGSHEIPLDSVFNAASTIKHALDWRYIAECPRMRAVRQATLFSNVVYGCARPDAGGGLPTILEATRNFDSTEPRDRIYGILSMVNDITVGTVPLLPDYRIPMAKLWANVAASYLTSKPALGARPYEVLCLARLSGRSRPTNRPSWAADFNHLSKEGRVSWERKSAFSSVQASQWQDPFTGVYYMHHARSYCASRTSELVVTYDDGQWWRLGLHGVAVTSIAHCLPDSQFPAHPREQHLQEQLGRLSPEEAAEYAETQLFPWYIRCLRFAFGDQATYASWKPFVGMVMRAESRIPWIPAKESSIDESRGDKHIDCLRAAADRAVASTPSQEGIEVDAPQMLTDLISFCYRAPHSHDLDLDRVMATTTDKRIAFVPSESRDGDMIFLFSGVPVPLVLRPTSHSNTFELVGDAYVQGLMFGRNWPENTSEMRVAFLV